MITILPYFIVLVTGLLLTAGTNYFIQKRGLSRFQQDFTRLADRQIDYLEMDFQHHLKFIQAIHLFNTCMEPFDKNRFIQFVKPLLEVHQGVQAILWLAHSSEGGFYPVHLEGSGSDVTMDLIQKIIDSPNVQEAVNRANHWGDIQPW